MAAENIMAVSSVDKNELEEVMGQLSIAPEPGEVMFIKRMLDSEIEKGSAPNNWNGHLPSAVKFGHQIFTKYHKGFDKVCGKDVDSLTKWAGKRVHDYDPKIKGTRFDGLVDRVAEPVDLAIRAGRLPGSDNITRLFRPVAPLMCADVLQTERD